MIENLGPAERIIQTVLSFADHMVHNRNGYVVEDRTVPYGLRWFPATYRVDEGGNTVVFRLEKHGKKTTEIRVGVRRQDGKIVEAGRVVGEYREAGIFPEVAAYLYRQIAEVWKLDNEFAARWASWAFKQPNRDLKVLMAAFMLVQNRMGMPVVVDGKAEFYDEDYRAVGEAMLLLWSKERDRRFDPKMIQLVKRVLEVPTVAAINRELKFGTSQRKPVLGKRYARTVHKWLENREANPKTLDVLIKNGFARHVRALAESTGYKPKTPRFFEMLRWKQKQAEDGRREIAIGENVTDTDRWDNLSEQEICEKIEKEKPGYKRVLGALSKDKFTRAVAMALVEAGSFTDKDLLVFTPTFEELGLMEVPAFKARLDKAAAAATDMRAINIAKNVKSASLKEKLEDAAVSAGKKAVAEVVKDMMIHVIVDKSASEEGAIERAKECLTKLLPAFPLDKLFVSVFDTTGREVKISHASKAGVENAFRGIAASGGTIYAQGVKAIAHHKPGPDQDLLMLFFGDEECTHPNFANAIRDAGLRPVAFGLIRVLGKISKGHGAAVRNTAAELKIPCFLINEQVFEDVNNIPQILRNLIASTPVGVKANAVPATPRLIEEILKTEILKRPVWAA